MRLLPFALLGVSLTLSTAALADDEGGGWFDEEQADPASPQDEPSAAGGPGAQKERIVVIEEGDEARVVKVRRRRGPPDWARGRRGKLRKWMPAIEGEEPPPGYRLGYKNRKNLWIPGVVLLAGGYAASALTAATAMMVEDTDCSFSFGRCDRREWGWGFLPLVGPFVIAADDDFEGGWRVAYTLMGISQAVGLGLTIGGAASKRPVWLLKPERRYRRAGEPPAQASTSPELNVGPGFLTFKTAF